VVKNVDDTRIVVLIQYRSIRHRRTDRIVISISHVTFMNERMRTRDEMKENKAFSKQNI